MEDRKFDVNAMVGFLLIGAILLWFSYNEQATEKNTQPQEVSSSRDTIKKPHTPPKKPLEKDSIPEPIIQKEKFITLENEVLKLIFSNRGAQLKKVLLKKYTTYRKKPLCLIKDGNSFFDMSFKSIYQMEHTKDIFFAPKLTQKDGTTILSFTLNIKNQSITYTYRLKEDYMIDFNIRSDNLESVVDTATPIRLNFHLKALSHEKSIKYENQNSALYYGKDNDLYDDLSISGSDKEQENHVNWVGFKQHFFSTILMSEKPFESAELRSESLLDGAEEKGKYTKAFDLQAPLKLSNGALYYDFNLYLGPNDYEKLASYGKGIDNIVELGWGIFGWINRHAFIPLFKILGDVFSNYGLIIILMTIIVRIFMSPLVYKSYLSSAKMKVLRPEMEEINKKYPGKQNAMKRQQEIMTLQRKAGVSMLSGCIPALLQMPVFFALFRFFPSAIDLRGKSFLWAEDLSSYDSILKLPFHIPLYGDHVSLFPILASVAIFFYMKMSQSQQMSMQQPAGEGMPDMQKMMKMMMYLSPVMMLVFFNSYGAGLSLYYFISNMLTLAIMFVIKNWIIDEDKIHAQIQENKKRPEKKKSKFRERFEQAMKEAQKRQELNRK